MDKYNYHIVSLIRKYLAESLSVEEHRELEEWRGRSPENNRLWERVVSGEAWEEREKWFAQINMEKALKRYDHHLNRRKIMTMRICGYAASLLLLLSLVFYWRFSEKDDKGLQYAEQIRPGGTKATLLFGDGQAIHLLSDTSRIIHFNQGLAESGESGIVYKSYPGEDVETEYNTIRTPRGGEYCVVLSDGTTAWLNAASSISFPVVFSSHERTVRVTGEVYFSVTRDTLRPFHVEVEGVMVEVLGTEFNIKTHFDDKIETLLVKGSVNIHGDKIASPILMHPGQLSEFTKSGEFLHLNQVETSPYVAWREGQFIFEDERLEEIMTTLSLWYDVDVFYMKPEIKDHRFTGHMKKYDNIDKILDAIGSIVEVKFSINDKVITVMEK